MKKYILPIIIFGIFVALPVYAALPSILPECAKGTGVPSLACFLALLGNISKWILGISGSLALLYFIYGGFMLLTSRGSQEQVTKGKTILSRAIIGVIIIFGAYTAITFLTKGIGFQESKFKIEEQKTPAGQQPASQEGPPAYLSSDICTCECSDGYIKTITATKTQTVQEVCQFECSARTPLYKGLPTGQKITVKSCK
ncbi:pilin [Patescibacteria group bacterium]|nr:pilin [Patescibacteria group bacterium]